MTADEIAAGITTLGPFHYQFDLDGQTTPLADPGNLNRHAQRRAYFFDPLVQALGGSLKGRTVLDLGCNAGWWSLAALHAGAEWVVGIDGRERHIDQARFVFQAMHMPRDRYEFIQGNVFDLELEHLGAFDVVLCLGLLYHVAKPVELLERISAVSTDLLLIDTTVSGRRGSSMEFRRQDVTAPLNALDYGLVCTPTRQALADMAGLVGYRTTVLRPRFTDWSGCRDYQVGLRRAFLCAKQTHVELPAEPTSTRPWVSLGAARRVKRALRRLAR